MIIRSIADEQSPAALRAARSGEAIVYTRQYLDQVTALAKGEVDAIEAGMYDNASTPAEAAVRYARSLVEDAFDLAHGEDTMIYRCLEWEIRPPTVHEVAVSIARQYLETAAVAAAAEAERIDMALIRKRLAPSPVRKAGPGFQANQPTAESEYL